MADNKAMFSERHDDHEALAQKISLLEAGERHSQRLENVETDEYFDRWGSERRELQRDVEMLCKQQAGSMGTIDVMARMQARRAAGLEKELAACKHKVAALTMDYADLQHDLAVARKAKDEVSGLVKAEVEKAKRADSDVKFYQTQVASALRERDEALLEVETCREEMEQTEARMSQLAARVEALEQQGRAQEQQRSLLQAQLAASAAQAGPLQQVVQRVWHEMGADAWANEEQHACGQAEAALDPTEMASALLERAGNGLLLPAQEHTERDSLAATVEELKQQLESAQGELRLARGDCQAAMENLEEERRECRAADRRAGTAEAALASYREQVIKELAHLREQQAAARDHAQALLREEQEHLGRAQQALLETVHLAAGQAAAAARAAEEAAEAATEEERERAVRTREGLEAQLRELRRALAKVHEQRMWGRMQEGEVVERDLRSLEDEDNRDALAQALHEKVSALLLLSQQEERHLLESRSLAAMEQQLQELAAKLNQAVREKVEALMLVAELRGTVRALEDDRRDLEQQLQQQRTTSMAGRMMPASWSGASPPPPVEQPASTSPTTQGNPADESMALARLSSPSMLAGSYFSTWLRTATNKDGSHVFQRKVSGSSEKEESSNIARLQVENSVLLESLESVDRCAHTVHRMRNDLLQARSEAEGRTVQAASDRAVATINGLAEEARRLKVALGGPSLPVSWPAGPPAEEPELGRSAGDIASFASVELAELVMFSTDLLRKVVFHRPE